MQAQITHLLGDLKEVLYQIYGDNLSGVYLYGSYANGGEDAESDLDVIIVLKDFGDYWEEVQRTSEVISKLSLEYGVSISPVRIREADWMLGDSPFLNNVRQESIPVLIAEVAEARQAYQAGNVRRGTVEDLLKELNA